VATMTDADEFTPRERETLAPHFTNLTSPVFALRNLPESVKGALFARYSRSAKSLRRLFLDEFHQPGAGPAAVSSAGAERADQLYERVFSDYGDDSVAQLGGAHLAVEGASNILTKILEWGRLMAYLEQSTRYVSYTDRPGGRWKYLVPEEVAGGALESEYRLRLDACFETYARWLEPLDALYAARHPRAPGDSEGVWRRAIRARSLDTLRGLLPAATRSNVGLYGTGQAWEALLLRLRAHPLQEARSCAEQMLVELRQLIPAFLTRVDRPDRGGAWSRYLAETRTGLAAVAARLTRDEVPEDRPEVTLSDFDPDGEIKVVAAALYASTRLPDDQLLALARRLTADERAEVLRACVGARGNRRHKPGRAFERTLYRFDILTDYGAFRDLQRHRLLTLDWQPLSPEHGYILPDEVVEVGAGADWRRAMDGCAALHNALVHAGLAAVAPYAVPLACRIRFYMEMNAREAMHMIELRTSPQGHASYRRVCQEMHRLIGERAGHRAIAGAMQFVDHSPAPLGRIEAERAAERRRQGRDGGR
jgi:thymidylate synthase ThyX